MGDVARVGMQGDDRWGGRGQVCVMVFRIEVIQVEGVLGRMRRAYSGRGEETKRNRERRVD